MTSTPGRGSRPIRIGNCSGFYGDRASAMADMARAGGIDVLTGDYLAEVTMLILGKARAKNSTTGYAATFLQHLNAALEQLVANRIRLVVNAGGLNPAGLAAATRELIARRGYHLRVSHIEGRGASRFSIASYLPRWSSVTTAGSSTWVTRQEPHRARRGRSVSVVWPRSRTLRVRACPQGRSGRAHPGQASSPAARSVSAWPL